MATQENFYHEDTERKLQAVANYLRSYLMVFKNQPNIETVYIDAFAGSGSMPLPTRIMSSDFLGEPLGSDATDIEEFVLGSAMRALRLEQSFSKYIFVEENKARFNELKARTGVPEFSNLNIVTINGNANEELLKLCNYLSKPNVRAVVFLDPFGNQVGWKLLEALAKTEHVDLWYLFPAMLGVYRQIGNSGAKMTEEQKNSLNKLFGPNDWKDAFIISDDLLPRIDLV